MTTETPKLSILVVEDSDIDFDLFLLAIWESAYELTVERCKTGQELLDRLTGLSGTQLPMLFLLDVNLPGMDGEEILLELARIGLLERFSVVAYSTSSNDEDRQRCLAAGAVRYLVKAPDLKQSRLELHEAFESVLAC